MSTQRQILFDRGSDWDSSGRKHVSHYKIHCSSCGGVDTIRFNRYTKSLPPDLIAKQFHSRGWVIGASRRNDVCPDCVAALTTDRQKRKDVAATEKRRASIDIVLKDKGVPAPTHPIASDKDYSNVQLMLFDRAAEIQRQTAYIEEMLEQLIDKAGALQLEQQSIVRRIAELQTPAPVGEQPNEPVVEDPVFTAIPHRRSGHPGRNPNSVRIAHYAKQGGNNPITIITIPVVIAKSVGMSAGNRVQLLAGTGEDAGMIKLEPTVAGGYKVMAGANGKSDAVRIISSLLRPAHAQQVHATTAEHSVLDGSLLLRLPQEFTQQPVAA